MAEVVIRGSAPTYSDLEIGVNTQLSYDLPVKNADGTNYSFSGLTAVCQIRKRAGAPLIVAPTITLSSGNIHFAASTATLAALTAQGARWELHLIDGSSEHRSFLYGRALILPSIVS